MLVRAMLEIPPDPGWIGLPRVAMVTTDGGNYVFVQEGADTAAYERRSSPDRPGEEMTGSSCEEGSSRMRWWSPMRASCSPRFMKT